MQTHFKTIIYYNIYIDMYKLTSGIHGTSKPFLIDSKFDTMAKVIAHYAEAFRLLVSTESLDVFYKNLNRCKLVDIYLSTGTVSMISSMSTQEKRMARVLSIDHPSFNGEITKMSWDTDQWSFKINDAWYLQSELRDVQTNIEHQDEAKPEPKFTVLQDGLPPTSGNYLALTNRDRVVQVYFELFLNNPIWEAKSYIDGTNEKVIAWKPKLQ